MMHNLENRDDLPEVNIDPTIKEGGDILEEQLISEIKEIDHDFSEEQLGEYLKNLDLKKTKGLYRSLSRFVVAFKDSVTAKYPYDDNDFEAGFVSSKSISKELRENLLFNEVEDALKRYADFSHLSGSEIASYKEYQTSCQNKEGIDRYEAYQWLRNKFLERSDKEFLESLSSIHWCSDINDLKKSLIDPYVQGSEMSCEGYLPSEETLARWGKGIGIKLKGEVVWASNSDARSDNRFIDSDGMTHKYSWGDGMGMILDDDTFLRANERDRHNELVIDNWGVEAIVVDFKRLKTAEFSIADKLGELIDVCKEYDLLMIDISGDPVDLNTLTIN